MQAIKVAVVDDQLLFRQSVSFLIGNQPGFSLVLEAENGRDCLDKLSGINSLPDVALIDMEMPEMDGMQLNSELREKYPSIKVIVLSIHDKETLIGRMVQSGASGYLLKNCDKAELVNAIQTVYNTGFYFNPAVLKAIQSKAVFSKRSFKNINSIVIDISKREIEILQLICQELSTAEIAAKLFLSIRTVEGHRNNLLQKTGCHNTAGLVLFAIRNHIFELSY